MQEVYFPKTGRGTILLTRRNFVTDESMAVVDLNELKMDDDTALRLLLRKNLTDDPKALDIVRELGHLPLAIDLADALMAEDKITPSKLLERYRKDVVSYLRLDDMLELTNSAYGKTVWTVWSVSIAFGDALRPAPKMTPSRPKIIPSRPRHLPETSASPPPCSRRFPPLLLPGFVHAVRCPHSIASRPKDPLAADLLRSIALLHPDTIPVIFFLHHSQNVLGLVDPLSARSVDIVLNHLCDFSLIYRTIRSDASDEDPAKDTFAIHRLVRTVVQLNTRAYLH